MSKNGFSLMELLVVIALIAMLMAITIPSLAMVKERAQQLRCKNNIKQQLVLLAAYDSANQSLPPSTERISYAPFGQYLGSAMIDPPQKWWIDYISQHKDDRNVGSFLWCPSSKTSTKPAYANNLLHSNYGANASVMKITDGYHDEFIDRDFRLSASQVPNPQRVMLVVDSGYATIFWYHVTESPPEPIKPFHFDHSFIPGLSINGRIDIIPEQEYDALSGRHVRRQVNAGFVDGHVLGKDADDFLVELTPNGYTNVTPLWSPWTR